MADEHVNYFRTFIVRLHGTERGHPEEIPNWLDFSPTNVSVNMKMLKHIFLLEKKTTSDVKLFLTILEFE